MNGSIQTIDLNNPEVDQMIAFSRQVVLYNDDINTFEHVIDCLILVCHHTIAVAKQIALEAHKEGRSIAYLGSHDDCLDKKIKLQNLGLTVQVESL